MAATNNPEKRLGEKIREMRLKKGMTQKELAGDRFTRNMLSLIENGTASPSVSTLLYIAEKLGTPAGYFFSVGAEDEAKFFKLTVIGELKELFVQKKYASCEELCSKLPQAAIDDEISYILAYSYMRTSIKASEELDIRAAASDLDRSSYYASRSIYCDEAFTRADTFYRDLIASACTEEVHDVLCCGSGEFIPVTLPQYFMSLKLIGNGIRSPFSLPRNSFFDRHLSALTMIAEGRNAEGQKRLRELSLDPMLPFYMRYKVLSDLERAADKEGDIRLAYSSSRRKLELIEQFRLK